MASIRRREFRAANGKAAVKWDATITKRGYPRITKTFSRKSTAEAWARAREHEMEDQRYRTTLVAERTTFGQLLIKYEESVLRTQASYETSGKYKVQRLRERLGTTPMIAMTHEVIANYRDSRLREHAQRSSGKRNGGLVTMERTVSPDSVRMEIQLIKRAIKKGREYGIVLPFGNPAAEVDLPKQGAPRERGLTEDEEKALAHALGKEGGTRNPWLLPFFVLALETAMRRGELLQIRWDQVDLDRRVITLDRQQTKSRKCRPIALSSTALAVLQALPRRDDEPRVLPTTENAVQSAWRRACKRANVVDLRVHDLRHEAATRLAARLASLGPAELQAQTGHRDLRSLGRYLHGSDKGTMARVNALR